MKPWEWIVLAALVYLLVLRKPMARAGAGAGATPAGRTTSAPSGGDFFSSFGSAIGSFLKSNPFGGSSSGGSSSASGSFNTGDGLMTPDFSAPAGFDTNNFTTSNGFEFTDDSGNFVAG